MKNKVRKPSFRVFVCIALIIFAVSLAIYSETRSKDLDNLIASNQTQLDALKKDIESLKNADKTEITPKQMKAKLVEAKQKGDEVAKLQNVYFGIAYTESDKLQANAKKLESYFGPDEMSAMTPWFGEDLTKKVSWAFESGYDLKGVKPKVLWLCKDSDGKIVAFATGVYDAKNDYFASIKSYVTFYGTSLVKDTSSGVDDKESLQKEIDKIGDIAGDDTPQYDEKEMQAIGEAREALRREHEGGKK